MKFEVQFGGDEGEPSPRAANELVYESNRRYREIHEDLDLDNEAERARKMHFKCPIGHQVFRDRWDQHIHESRARTPSPPLRESINSSYRENSSEDHSTIARSPVNLLIKQGAHRSPANAPKSYDFSPQEIEKLHEAIRQGKTHRQAYVDFPEIGAAKFKSRFYRVKSAMAAQGLL